MQFKSITLQAKTTLGLVLMAIAFSISSCTEQHEIRPQKKTNVAKSDTLRKYLDGKPPKDTGTGGGRKNNLDTLNTVIIVKK